MFSRIIKSFKYAVSGFNFVIKEELNFRIEIFIGIFVLFLSWFLHFSWIEFLFVLVAIFMVLMAEIVNTAVEDICNRIEPKEDPVIGKIKDIMAAYVLLSSLASFLIGIVIFYHHIF